jgi:hypothetical protein
MSTTTSTATVVTMKGYAWRVTAELAAVDETSRAEIDAALRAFVEAIQDGEPYSIEVTVPDHPAIVELREGSAA